MRGAIHLNGGYAKDRSGRLICKSGYYPI